jgi:hypothetical protein
MFNILILTTLHDANELARIVVVEGGSGAHSSADTAVHTRLQALLEADILLK